MSSGCKNCGHAAFGALCEECWTLHRKLKRIVEEELEDIRKRFVGVPLDEKLKGQS